MFTSYMKSNGLSRMALVGTNSQGKSYMITKEVKQLGKKVVFITNEVKADENLKNSTDSSTLVMWLNSLLDNSKAKEAIQEEIDKIDLAAINNGFLEISLKNELNSYKGIVNAEIKTDSNKWKKPGSGERFLGQLLLISKILEDNKDDNYEYLIIDEPEQHLHPSLYIKVAKILNRISKQGIKVIIATHSPTITKYFIDDTNEIAKVINGECNFLPSKKKFIMDSLKYDCYTDSDLKMADFIKIESNYDLYFENFVLPIIINSLFNEVILLGEGMIERKIFELFLLHNGESFDLDNIGFGISDGKVFLPIILSCLSIISVKTITLFDLDDESNKKHISLNKHITNLSTKIIPFKTRIEDYFSITKDMGIDKYRGAIIYMNSLYLNKDHKLFELFEKMEKSI